MEAGRARRAAVVAASQSADGEYRRRPSLLASLRERNADLDEEHPPEDQVEERQKDVQDDESADRDDRETERADPPQGQVAGRSLALEHVLRISRQNALE